MPLQGHLKHGGRSGRRGSRIKARTVSFYQDNEAKEADVKGEYSSNGKESMSKSRAAGAPRQGVASAPPQLLSPSRAAPVEH